MTTKKTYNDPIQGAIWMNFYEGDEFIGTSGLYPTSAGGMIHLQGTRITKDTVQEAWPEQQNKRIIWDVRIREDLRGKGLGERVMTRVLRECIKMNLCEVSLFVHSENLVAKNLYRKLGFHAIRLTNITKTNNHLTGYIEMSLTL